MISYLICFIGKMTPFLPQNLFMFFFFNHFSFFRTVLFHLQQLIFVAFRFSASVFLFLNSAFFICKNECKMYKIYFLISKVIFETEGSIRQRYKRALFPCKKLLKGASNLSKPYINNIIALFFLDKNKSLSAASECRTQFWPTITYAYACIPNLPALKFQVNFCQ